MLKYNYIINVINTRQKSLNILVKQNTIRYKPTYPNESVNYNKTINEYVAVAKKIAIFATVM